MSNGRIFTNPNVAKSIVIIDKMIFAIFIQSHFFVNFKILEFFFSSATLTLFISSFSTFFIENYIIRKRNRHFFFIIIALMSFL